MSYTPVIGLEIHAELLTSSKVYCSCKNEFGNKSNSTVCPVCSALPGTLPTINKDAVTLAVRAGLCFNSEINNYSRFDRKNYFYPDLPKAYQITQYYHPICTGGYVDIGNKTVRINRIHIEEDAGKLIHSDSYSLADYNRCGVPLIEIVTEPDFNSPDEVKDFIEEVILRLKYADICDAKLEEGSLRVDVNISIKKDSAYGAKTELKNLNSTKSIKKALEYEIKRHIECLENGVEIIKETRRFDEANNKTISLRLKSEDDYRYFPEPDLPTIFISDEEIKEIKASLPKGHKERLTKYINEYNLSPDDAVLIIKDRDFSDFYDEAVSYTDDYKTVCNFMLTCINQQLNNLSIKPCDIPFSPKDLTDTVMMVKNKEITNNAAKEIIRILFEVNKSPEQIAKEYDLYTQGDKDKITAIAKQIINDNENAAKSYKDGNSKIFGFFMGQMIHKCGKNTDPEIIRQILDDLLSKFY